VLIEFGGFNSGDAKGAIRSDVRLRFVSNDVRRRRLISVSYIASLPSQAGGRGFESRRSRQLFVAALYQVKTS